MSARGVPAASVTRRQGDWRRLVRLVDLHDIGYRLRWGLEYTSEMCLAAAPFGGLIAACRITNEDEATTVRVFSSLGVLVTQFECDERVKFLCWNERVDHLLVLSEDGTVYFYGAHNGAQVADPQVVGTPEFWASTGTGMVVFTAERKVVLVQCQLRTNEYILVTHDVEPVFTANVSAMLAIPAEFSESGYDEVLLAPDEADTEAITSLYRVTMRPSGSGGGQRGGQPPAIQDCKAMIAGGAIIHMTLSPTGKHFVMVSASGMLHRATIDARNVVGIGFCKLEDDLGDDDEPPENFKVPHQLFWIGDNTVGYTHLEYQFDREEKHEEGTPTLTLMNFLPDERAPYIEHVSIPQDCTVLPEVDSVRIVTGTESNCQHTVVQVVPDYAAQFYSMSATRPAALLRTAYDDYKNKDAACVKTLRQLTGGHSGSVDKLTDAIHSALETAGWEWDIAQQQRLLRVASYGKVFCSTFDSQLFVDVCSRVRVLHSIRSQVGMIITMNQLRVLEGDRLVNRITCGSLDRFKLATEIAGALGIKPDGIMVQWAKALVKKKLEVAGLITIDEQGTVSPSEQGRHASDASSAVDEEVAQAVASLLAPYRKNNLSYIPVAQTAIEECKRQHLFVRLVELDPSPERQVDALLAYAADVSFMERALTKAVNSGDGSLVFYCLRSLSRTRMTRILSDEKGTKTQTSLLPKVLALSAEAKDPIALDLTAVMVRHFETLGSTLKEDFWREDPFLRVNMSLEQYFREFQRFLHKSESDQLMIINTQGAVLSDATHYLSHAARSGGGGGILNTSMGASEGKDQLAMAGALKNQEKLLDIQADLYKRTGEGRFLNASVAKTIEFCVLYNQGDKADALRTNFKVPDKMFWWARLKGLVARKDWQAVKEFGGIAKGTRSWGKSPIGYEPFVTELIAAGDPFLASQFIVKVSAIEDRLELYILCNEWGAAVQDCLKNKREEFVDQIRHRAANNPDALRAIERAASNKR